MRCPLGGLCLSLFMIFVPPQTQAAGEKPVISAELMVYCGREWQTTIFASGFAHRHVIDTCDPFESAELIRVTKAQIVSIAKAARHAGFCQLPELIKPTETNVISTEHDDYLTVTLRLEGQECKVGAWDLAHTSNWANVNRFLEVWSAITGVIPEPVKP